MKRIVSVLLVAVMIVLCALPALAEESVTLPKVKKLAAKSVTTAGKVSLTWKKVAGATGYEVYRKGPDETTFSLLKTVAKNKAAVKEHIAGYPYEYRVRAFAQLQEVTTYGEPSDALSVKVVRAPTQLKVTPATGGKATVRFTAAEGAGRYQIYMRAKDEKSYTRVTTLRKDTHKYVLTKLEAGQTYYVRVRSYWKIGEKAFYSPWTGTKTFVAK